MRVVIVAFDQFTDIDLFLAWDLLNRVEARPFEVRLVAAKPTVVSSTGIAVAMHGTLAETRDADAVYFTSGRGTRALSTDRAFLDAVKLDERRQILCAIDSGALL